jgi:hypothetical protein
MKQDTRRTVQIKLRQTPEQADEIEKLFAAFEIGLNFSLTEIEKAYQKAMAKYTRVAEGDEVDGVCAGCNKERRLVYSSEGKSFCAGCVMREYSEYTVRSAIIGTANRPVERNIKDTVALENQTHFFMMFVQAYAIWKSFDTWRKKREFERSRIEKELSKLEEENNTKDVFIAANQIWVKAGQLQRENKKLTRLRAMALASKEIYNHYPDVSRRDITRVVNKLRKLNSLKRPPHFPECETVKAIQLHKNFVQFKKGKLHISLFNKRNNGQVIDFYGNKYLNQFINAMEEDNAVYTNLIKRADGKKTNYYLMYPLTVKKNILTIHELVDVFTICFSPDRVLVHAKYNGNNGTGAGEGSKWFRLSNLIYAKKHFSDKRSELQKHNTRNSLRRVKKMGNIEQRFTRTFNHQLSHDIIEYITDNSDKPLIVMWDIRTGITADYGKRLNSIKKLWPVVQQQEFIKHKAFLRCIPAKMIPYKKEKDLTCSFCGKPLNKKDEFGKPSTENIKTITALLRRVKNIKCDSCRHELNLLINQARNLNLLSNTTPS